MPPFYVGLCHIRPKTGLAQGVMEQFVGVIKQNGGIVRRVNNAGIRPLPTEMRGKGVGEMHKFANITTVEFVANPVTARTALDQVRSLDDVLRANLLRADDILLRRPPRPKPYTTKFTGGSPPQEPKAFKKEGRLARPRMSFVEDLASVDAKPATEASDDAIAAQDVAERKKPLDGV